MAESVQTKRAHWRTVNPWRKGAFLRKRTRGYTWGDVIGAVIKPTYRYEHDPRRRRRFARKAMTTTGGGSGE